MHATLAEILRNLKRHRGTAEWKEPERIPAKGELRGFQWEFPSGRKLSLRLDPSGQSIEVTKEGPDLNPDEPATYSIASNELALMRDLYQWVAGTQ